MFDSILKTIRQTYSGERGRRHVAVISQFHRIQASPGYRDAARYVHEQLEAAGLNAELLSFPATEKASFWTAQSFQEWSCAEATLDLLSDGQADERLCDFSAIPVSIIQRSAPADGTYDVIVLNDGTQEAHYEGLDVAGKLVLTDADISRVYDLAVRRRGAAGILFDGMSTSAPARGPLDLPDARQYTSFWWQPGQPKCFGFVLTPRQGRQLRDQDGVQVRARVDSELYDGALEVVTAFIPGQTDEEVLVVAHLCHPQPSANDNASGAAASIEIAATLRRLIDEDQLAPPRRGIRFIWVPEMMGTYAYLAAFEERLPRMVAGVNLDMVGQDQYLCHSTFTIERPPEAMSSFAPVLLKGLWDAMVDGTPPATPMARANTVRHQVAPFTGGSDHFILSDPTVGVPTPMLIQWPDRFYHTSADTVEKVDPVMLGRIGSLAATYAYVVATAGQREATWLGHEIVTRRKRRLARLAQDAIGAALAAETAAEIGQAYHDLRKAVAHRVACDAAALDSLQRLWPEAGALAAELRPLIEQAAQRELERAEAVCRRAAGQLGANELPQPAGDKEAEWRQRAGQLVPVRQYRGPLALRSLLGDLPPAERDALWESTHELGYGWWTARSLAEYWADGRRTVAEIVEHVEHETGMSLGPQILAFFEFLAKNGMVAL